MLGPILSLETAIPYMNALEAGDLQQDNSCMPPHVLRRPHFRSNSFQLFVESTLGGDQPYKATSLDDVGSYRTTFLRVGEKGVLVDLSETHAVITKKEPSTLIMSRGFISCAGLAAKLEAKKPLAKLLAPESLLVAHIGHFKKMTAVADLLRQISDKFRVTDVAVNINDWDNKLPENLVEFLADHGHGVITPKVFRHDNLDYGGIVVGPLGGLFLQLEHTFPPYTVKDSWQWV